MAIIGYTIILFLIAYTLFICYQYCKARREGTLFLFNWPFFGMTPHLLLNAHRIHDFANEILQGNGYTFEMKGPWLASTNMMVTSDPANIHYMLSTNFSNYPKGPEFKKIFDVLGEGIFNAESESWENQRKALVPLVKNLEFQRFVGMTSWKKLEKGVIPVLEHAVESGMEIDLQELFDKFTFDSSCITAVGHDPVSLGIDLPENQYIKAFADAEEAILYRHVVPATCWKLQSWLQIGKEKKLSEAKDSLNQFLAMCISSKYEQLEGSSRDGWEDLDLLTGYIKTVGVEQENGESATISEKVWGDALLNLIFAGKDTISAGLSWFFWLLAMNPIEENIVLQEMLTNLDMKEEGWQFSDIEELKNLVYLHGAICESLRLFPPVALQHKAPVKPDILPSGHRINPNTKTVLAFHTMGRMETIWGKDCSEFKPGRWITERGGIKHEPSFKFTAFNAGPRSCLGKEMSFIQMKIVAAAILCRFHFDIIEGQCIVPSESIILRMKHGLKVKVSSRRCLRQPT